VRCIAWIPPHVPRICYMTPSHLWHDSLSFVTWNTLQHTATRCNTLQVIDRYHQRHGDPNLRTLLPHLQVTQKSVLQYVAVSCSELQRVAVCCRVLHLQVTQNSPISYQKKSVFYHCSTLYQRTLLTHPLTTGGCGIAHWNTLQHTATHCNTLQHTVTHCNTLQRIATHGKTLQHTATHINALQARTGVIAVASSQYRSTLQHTAMHCNTLHHTATSYSTWRESFAAASSSLLHIAPHCNALPLTATPYSTWRESVVAVSSSPITLCNTLQLIAADYIPLQYLAGTVCSCILCVPSCSSHDSQFFFGGHVCPFFSFPSTHHRNWRNHSQLHPLHFVIPLAR